jgi:glycosyltransferase involved in cell wall biosynthesis
MARLADGGTSLERTHPFVSVVVPAYNEVDLIENSLTRLTEYMATIEDTYPWEIVVVDDGSTDGTGEAADRFADAHDNVRVLHHFENFQLGQALRFAFANCRGDVVVTIDCDLSYSPDHIGRLLDAITVTRAKIVIASPYMKGGTVRQVPFVRRLASRWANRFLSLTAKEDLHTVTGMVRAYDRRFLRTLNLKAMDMEVNTEIIYKAQLLRAKIVEIPATLDWSFREGIGQSRRSTMRLVRSTASSMFTGFLFRPFMFFILPGLVLFALSAYVLAWAAVRIWGRYWEVGGGFADRVSAAVHQAYLAAPHTFIVGGLMLVVSIQLLSLGVLSLQSKRYFEELFHLNTSIHRRLLQQDEDDHAADVLPRRR